MCPDRRTALATAAALPLFAALPPVAAADAALDSELVRLDSGIEPLVRLLEDTPRDRLVEEVAARIKKGLGYRDVLAALLLAGVRNVPPRPSVGFKFHAVLVVNSAHQASLAGPENQRWLPLLWAIDTFKSAQAQALKEGGWRMRPADEPRLPPAHKARAAFVAAMDAWDEPAADAAVAALARTAGAGELFDLFARYGGRDFRAIGHKAIFVANAFRTLQVIGWRHAEPVLRSLAFALLQHEGDSPASRDAAPDRPGRRNAELATKIKPGWAGGRADAGATAELLATLRIGTDAEAAEAVVGHLNAGVGPGAVWDGLFLAAAELLMRQPGIVALHTLTTLNALRYAVDAAGDDPTRRLLTLQAASFLPLFRADMGGRGKVGDARIDQIEPADTPADLGEVFAAASRDRATAARQALGYLRATADGGRGLTDAARLLVFRKGTDAHDYKFSVAVTEDAGRLSADSRDRFLAASLFALKGSAGPDTPLVGRVRAALG